MVADLQDTKSLYQSVSLAFDRKAELPGGGVVQSCSSSCGSNHLRVEVTQPSGDVSEICLYIGEWQSVGYDDVELKFVGGHRILIRR